MHESGDENIKDESKSDQRSQSSDNEDINNIKQQRADLYSSGSDEDYNYEKKSKDKKEKKEKQGGKK